MPGRKVCGTSLWITQSTCIFVLFGKKYHKPQIKKVVIFCTNLLKQQNRHKKVFLAKGLSLSSGSLQTVDIILKA